jgi:hypothetical protein
LGALGGTARHRVGGRTKFNRCRLGIPKTHALDAAGVGEVEALVGWNIPTHEIKVTGRGTYCRTKFTAQGFPRGYCVRTKHVHGFRTGDMVRAVVLKGARLLLARASSPSAESKTLGGNGAASCNAGMDMDKPSGKPASAGCALNPNLKAGVRRAFFDRTGMPPCHRACDPVNQEDAADVQRAVI